MEAALAKHSVASVPDCDWSVTVTVGPVDAITANRERPVADIARATLLVRVDDLGIQAPDTIMLHPERLTTMRIAYVAETTAALESFGITSVRNSLQVPNGTA